MCNVGLERRRRGNYGQHNLGQYPVSVSTQNSSWIGVESPSDDANRLDLANAHIWQAPRRWDEGIPTAMPPSLYEKARRDLDFDVTSLSHLTSILLGRKAAQVLASEPHRLAGLLFENKWSYINFVPIRFEESPLLQDLLFCIASQSRHVLQKQTPANESVLLRRYGTALQRLQKAVGDANECLEPDILCAVELLGVLEVIVSTMDSILG